MIPVNAQPFEFRFDPDSVVLIVIDMQRDFIEPGGFGETLGNDISHMQRAIGPTAELLKLFRERGWPVVHTRENHAGDLSDCPPAKRERGNPTLRIGDDGPMGRILIRGEPGAEIIADCAAIEGETVIDKPGKGAFYATPLGDLLAERGTKSLVFAGVTTEVCVQTTIREANDRGFECLLIEEATESYFPEFKAATLDMIRAQGGIVGWTAPLASFRAALENET
ncbi:cysteine hydrolase family protein [Roseibium aggregatum]|uniref:Cysteine hydrolase n=1 Tax=Roseibium aggregatum TaxID=187304 RepID=A0A939EIN6_9HYPH|nr:isochorismatase family cysteine hydrolase [Roseibium aggregatum]MBN9672324.1 cysteine hydrolase [Roseibium aggregatum]